MVTAVKWGHYSRWRRKYRSEFFGFNNCTVADKKPRRLGTDGAPFGSASEGDKTWLPRSIVSTDTRICANIVSMAKQETMLAQKNMLAQKKKRGPAPTGINPMIGVRMPPDELARLDAFIADQSESMNRPTAIRKILGEFLKRRGVKR